MLNDKFKSSEEIESEIRKITVEYLGQEPDRIILPARFIEDLEADSLDTVELVMALEESFHLEVPDDAATTIRTVGDLLGHLVHEYTHNEERGGDFITTTLAFRIGEHGKIEVGLRGTDGSWVFADNAKHLPCGIYIVSFNRWSEVLKELEELINSDQVRESDLQVFFENHPELLKGDEYDCVVPQAVIRPDTRKVNWRADFVLHPIDQNKFCKIVELKLPSQPLIKTEKSGHGAFYFGLHAAVQQLKDYGQAFSSENTRERFKQAYGIDVFQPDLQLVVGRRWDVNHITAMLERQRRDVVEIVDWDTALDQLRRKFT
jgi:acyl carrier protein